MAYKVLVGSVLEKIKEIESESVDSVITSPPYFGLRDYGVDEQIGLEDSLEEYIGKMVEVFREVHRVLKPTGTVWLNLGDSYAGSNQIGRRDKQYGGGLYEGKQNGWESDMTRSQKRNSGLKQKDLMMIPHRVAIALQNDGWYVRQDIVWAKNNPMPEAVKDRCTKAHEYIFLITKDKKYYYNHNAILEPTISQTSKKNKRSIWNVNTKPFKKAHFAVYPPELIEPCVLTTPTKVCVGCGRGYVEQMIVEKILTLEEVNKIKEEIDDDVTKSMKPYSVKEKEFRKRVIEFRNLPHHDIIREYLQKWRKNAEMTIKEVELHFGDSAGHHWFEKNGNYPTVENWWELKSLFNFDDSLDLAMTQVFYKSGLKGDNDYASHGFVKDCNCDTDETKPAVILDIFAGSGTTGGVAEKYGRDSILIELNPEYAKLIPERIKSIQVVD
jgi:site-specific DNA-methyltransferase (adenine-specific)